MNEDTEKPWMRFRIAIEYPGGATDAYGLLDEVDLKLTPDDFCRRYALPSIAAILQRLNKRDPAPDDALPGKG